MTLDTQLEQITKTKLPLTQTNSDRELTDITSLLHQLAQLLRADTQLTHDSPLSTARFTIDTGLNFPQLSPEFIAKYSLLPDHDYLLIGEATLSDDLHQKSYLVISLPQNSKPDEKNPRTGQISRIVISERTTTTEDLGAAELDQSTNTFTIASSRLPQALELMMTHLLAPPPRRKGYR